MILNAQWDCLFCNSIWYSLKTCSEDFFKLCQELLKMKWKWKCNKQEACIKLRPFKLNCLIWFKTLLETIKFHDQSLDLYSSWLLSDGDECLIKHSVSVLMCGKLMFLQIMICFGSEVLDILQIFTELYKDISIHTEGFLSKYATHML